MPLSVRDPAGNTGSVSPPSWQRPLFSQISFCFVYASIALATLAPVNAARPGKRLKHWPTAAFGCRQAPGSRTGACLLAHSWALHGHGVQAPEPFSHGRGSPGTSHPSQPLPLPHVWGPSHLIRDSLPARLSLRIHTECITHPIAILFFFPLSHSPGAPHL